MPRRRRRAQLRRQRQGAARRRSSRTSGFSRRRATPAARSARRWRPITIFMGQPRTARTARDAMQRRLSRARPSRRPRSSAGCASAGASFTVLDGDRADRATARRRWPTARPSAGSRAAWSSGRARSAPARSWATRARPRMQKMLNLKVKYRETFRPFAPVGAARGCRRLVRARCRQPLHAAGRRRAQANGAARMTRRGAGAVRHRQAQRAALGDSGGDPCRLFGAHPDRACRHQSALPRADFALQGA